MEPFKVLFVPTANAGVNYWRMWNPATAMYRMHNAHTAVLWYDRTQKDLNRWEAALVDGRARNDYMTQESITQELWAWARQSDAIVFGMLHSKAGLDIVESLIEARNMGRLRNVPILMEIDDNILSVPTANPAYQSYEPGSSIRDVVVRQMKMSDGIICSTPYLAEIYSEFNHSVHVIPNCIDFGLWGNLKNKPKPGIRIGWAGGSAHTADLEILESVIPAVLGEHKDVRFCFVHGISQMIKDMADKYPGRIELITGWSEIDAYPKFIAGLDWDIALAPLVDSSFNRAKSNLRWLEAGALAVPCIASDVGHFSATLAHGTDCLLCDTNNSAESFIENIRLLVRDGSMRKRMGIAARKKIFDDFNVDKIGKVYTDTLIMVSNQVADAQVDRAQQALNERENESIPVTDDDRGDGRGRGSDQVHQLLP